MFNMPLSMMMALAVPIGGVWTPPIRDYTTDGLLFDYVAALATGTTPPDVGGNLPVTWVDLQTGLTGDMVGLDTDDKWAGSAVGTADPYRFQSVSYPAHMRHHTPVHGLNPAEGEVELWYKPLYAYNAGGGWGFFQLGTTLHAATNVTGWMSLFKYTNNNVYWRIMENGNAYQNVIVSGGFFGAAMAPIMLSAVWSAAAGHTRLYYNGNTIAGTTTGFVPPSYLMDEFVLGTGHGYGAQGGLMAARAYTRVLSDAERLTNYNAFLARGFV